MANDNRNRSGLRQLLGMLRRCRGTTLAAPDSRHPLSLLSSKRADGATIGNNVRSTDFGCFAIPELRLRCLRTLPYRSRLLTVLRYLTTHYNMSLMKPTASLELDGSTPTFKLSRIDVLNAGFHAMPNCQESLSTCMSPADLLFLNMSAPPQTAFASQFKHSGDEACLDG